MSVQRVRIPVADGGLTDEHLEGQHFTGTGGMQTFIQNIPIMPTVPETKPNLWDKTAQPFVMPPTPLPPTMFPNLQNISAFTSSSSAWPFGSSFFDSFKSLMSGSGVPQIGQQNPADLQNMAFSDLNNFFKPGMWQQMNSFSNNAMNGNTNAQNTMPGKADMPTIQQSLGSMVPETGLPQPIVEPTNVQNTDIVQTKPKINEISTIENFKRINNITPPNQIVKQQEITKHTDSFTPNAMIRPSQQPLIDTIQNNFATLSQNNVAFDNNMMHVTSTPNPLLNPDLVYLDSLNGLLDPQPMAGLDLQSSQPNWNSQWPLVGSNEQSKLVGANEPPKLVGQGSPQFLRQTSTNKRHLSNTPRQPAKKEDSRIVESLQIVRDRMTPSPWLQGKGTPAQLVGSRSGVVGPLIQSSNKPLVGGIYSRFYS